jgi:ABC-type oligopeptide transport system substrate-binding subunit
MKKLSLFVLLLLATSCATVGTTNSTTSADAKQPPAYYTGNDEPAALSMHGGNDPLPVGQPYQ